MYRTLRWVCLNHEWWWVSIIVLICTNCSYVKEKSSQSENIICIPYLPHLRALDLLLQYGFYL